MRAFVAEKDGDGVERAPRDLDPSELGEDPILVRVEYSSVNYKDALATIPKGGVAKLDLLVPGIDLAGTVEEAPDDAPVAAGDQVLAHGYDLGVAHHGGYAEQARLPAEWVVPLPDGLTTRQAMAIGTAGYTAARSVVELERRGHQPGAGPVLVTGASGGVGSMAVAMLAGLGHEVVASTGTADAADWLGELGAGEVIDRDEVIGDPARPLASQRFAAAVDCVGGDTLAGVLRSLRRGGTVAASGNTGGLSVPTTVLPFILRGAALVGVDSVQTPIDERIETWQRLAGDLRPRALDEETTAREIGLDELDGVLAAILEGQVRGRTVVRLG